MEVVWYCLVLFACINYQAKPFIVQLRLEPPPSSFGEYFTLVTVTVTVTGCNIQGIGEYLHSLFPLNLLNKDISHRIKVDLSDNIVQTKWKALQVYVYFLQYSSIL